MECVNCQNEILNRGKKAKLCLECLELSKKNSYKKYSEKDSIKSRKVEYSKEYYDINKEKLKPVRKKWRDDNKEKQIEYNKERYEIVDKERLSNYYKQNKEEINRKKTEYRKTDEYKKWKKEYDMKNSYRNRYRDSLKSVIRRLKLSKNDYTNNLLGYSDLEFKIHIENQFTVNMSWENRKSFEIDHIIPIVAFLDETPLSIVSALDNLKPMDPYDNVMKFTSIDYEYIHIYEKYIDYLNDEYKSQILEFLSK